MTNILYDVFQAYWRATVPPVKAINPIGIPKQKPTKPDPNSSPSIRREQTFPDNGLSGSKGLSSKVGTPLGSGHGGPGSIHGGPGSVHGGPGSIHGGPGSVHGGPGSVYGGPGSVHGGSIHGGSLHGSGLCRRSCNEGLTEFLRPGQVLPRLQPGQLLAPPGRLPGGGRVLGAGPGQGLAQVSRHCQPLPASTALSCRPPVIERGGYHYEDEDSRWQDDHRMESGHYDRYHGNTLPRHHLQHQHPPPGNGRDYYDDREASHYSHHPPHNRNYQPYEDDFHSMHQHYEEDY